MPLIRTTCGKGMSYVPRLCNMVLKLMTVFLKMLEGLSNFVIKSVLSRYEDQFLGDLPNPPPNRSSYNVPIYLQQNTIRFLEIYQNTAPYNF